MSTYVINARSAAMKFWKLRGVFFYMTHAADTHKAFRYCCELNAARGLDWPPRLSARGGVFMPMHADDYPAALAYCQTLDRKRRRVPIQ